MEVRDDDTAELVLNTTRLTIREGTEQTYQVKLGSNPSANQTVTPEMPTNSPVSLSSAVIFNPCSRVPGVTDPPPCSEVAEPWDEWQTVTVMATQNTIDNNGSPKVTITNTATGYATAKKVEVTITDDDGTSGVVLSRRSLSITDSNDSDGDPLTQTYTVKLRSAGNETIVVSNPGGLTLAPTQLVFTEDGNETHPVTVTVIPNDVDDGDRSVIIKHTRSTTGFVGAEVSVTIRDDDVAKLEIERKSSSETINEAGTVEYGVRLKSSASGRWSDRAGHQQ